MDTVFFWASKLVWALISPDSLLLLLWLGGLALLLCGALHYAKVVLLCAACFALAVAFLPLGEWLGLLAYYVTGKTASLFPSQSSQCVRSS